jgi:hypothetical protein
MTDQGVKVTRMKTVIISAMGGALFGLAAINVAGAQTVPGGRNSPAMAKESSATEFSAQSRPARARTRVRVSPAYPYRTFSTDYPVPYKYEYPGPGAVRQCASWLRPEYRLSGTVIVPKMQCWWEPG